MTERVVVIVPAPTANGDLHLGHIAGPFLAADVYTRYARAAGREVLFGTGIQDTQTFVVTTAHRLGTTPRALATRSTAEVEASLATLGIAVDGFTTTPERFLKVVRDFFERLHSAGRLRLRAMPFPYLPRTGDYLVDGLVRGHCPVCLAGSCAGSCESCGHPVAPGDLIDPHPTMFPDEPVRLREVPVLVLPMEEYRDRLRDYFARTGPGMRPRLAQAIQEMLSRPLTDFPITFPISWGIPAPFPEVAGQVVNPFAEAMAWSLHCTALCAERRGAVLAAEDELWFPDAGSEVVYFLGFDNTHPFAVAGVALLFAHDGRYRLPEQFVTNDFYELDYEKFSTSRGHTVSGRDLVAEVPRDLVRYHLAATSPELQRTDFSRDAVARITGPRLVRPWNRVVARVDEWAGQALPVSGRAREVAARLGERFAAAYELPWFSLNRAAATLAEQLDRLDRWTAGRDDAGDFCHQVEVVLRGAAPILVDLAGQAPPDPGVTGGPGATCIVPRRLPRLGGRAA